MILHSEVSINFPLPRSPAAGPVSRTVTGPLPWIEDPAGVSPRDARSLSRVFFARLGMLEEGSREYQYVRNTLIEMNRSLVRYTARRYRNRGNGEMEDIIQVGIIGLIKAVDRFDVSRDVEFTSYAIPCIAGEIKRYFRNDTWAVHVPRRLQELRIGLGKAREHLASTADHEPTIKELAAYLELSDEEIVEGLVAAQGYIAAPLDAPHDTGGDPDKAPRPVAERLGVPDHGMDLVEDFLTLAPLLDKLDARARQIIQMRFGQDMTQLQIGEEIGISQMHVSRLLARALAQLRTGMLDQ
ncbi:SigB/SigF/SigG family RNA polymerase sigma factor [Streptomyces sp. NPDC056437]|uniref:SigB/SigF/SigG family RNA polymerase sigma factor n=1 Tax=Streptomyces sp. NPDC056437 TaxID=3345816 RepID=UPI0036CAFFCF